MRREALAASLISLLFWGGKNLDTVRFWGGFLRKISRGVSCADHSRLLYWNGCFGSIRVVICDRTAFVWFPRLALLFNFNNRIEGTAPE